MEYLYIEIINAIFSLFIFIMLAYILWIMVKKEDVFKSIMFLKGDKLKNPTLFIAFGIMLFMIREIYESTRLFGFPISHMMLELLELGNIIMIFIGTLMIVKLFNMKST